MNPWASKIDLVLISSTLGRMNPGPLFRIARDEQAMAGPYDLVQMAGLLRRKIITPETMTCLDGCDDWKPFAWQPQYAIAREMSPDAASARVDALNEQALLAIKGPIPRPSRETLLKLAGLAGAVVLAFVAGFLLARLDPTLGYLLVALGLGAMAVAWSMSLVRVLDEDYRTLFLIGLVPAGGLYYFLANFWTYFPWFCLRFIGAAVGLGAFLGLR